MTDKSVTALETQVEATRQDIAATIEALQARLTPQHLFQGAQHSASEAGEQVSQSITQLIGNLGNQLQERLHDMPAITAALGAVVAWLTTRANQGATATADNVGQQAQTTAEAALAGAQAQAGQLAEQVRVGAEQATDRLHQGADLAKHQLNQTLRQMEQILQENPWLVGGAMIAVGIALGMALPETAQEREWFTQARDTAGQRLQTLFNEALQMVKPTTSSATEPQA
jgi:ElaB/YqjD/DUF883 family membrane-anchored ribosome-binding protein